MNFQKIIFFILLLVVSLFLSAIVSSFLNYNILNIHQLGFQFVIFSILGSFVYFTSKYLRVIDSIIVVMFLSVLYALILKKTSMLIKMGGFLPLILYALFLFLVYMIIFKLIWFWKIRFLRNLTFSVLASFGYTLVHIIVHLILKTPIMSQFITMYFTNSFIIMLTISTSFSIVEFMMIKIENLIKTPERIKPSDIEENEDDIEESEK